MNSISKLFSVLSLFGMFSLTAIAQDKVAKDIEVVVHRGANALAPENTVASADSALAHGAKWIEVDVRPSKDGVLFNLHDGTLDRTTDGQGKLVDMMSADVKHLDCGSWFGEKFRGTRMPTIEDMMDALSGKAYMYFDVKEGTNLNDLVSLVRRKGYTNRSFFWFGDEDMLCEFVKLAPEMKVKVNAKNVAKLRHWLPICTPAIIEINANDLTPEFHDFCRLLDIKVMVGAQGESIDDYRKAIATGAEMINLDKPELFETLRR